MRRKRFLGLLPAFCLLALPVFVQAANELKLSDAFGEYATTVSVDLTLTTDDQVQGVVAVFEWDDSKGVKGMALDPVSPLLDSSLPEGADTVVTRIEDNYMVLGVVMDSNPNDNGAIQELIEPGAVLLATATLSAADNPGDQSDVVTPLTFVNGSHASAEGGPALDNIVVIGGMSVDPDLVDGSITSTPAPDTLTIVSVESESTEVAEVPVTMNVVDGEVEGFVVVACFDPAEIAFQEPADPMGLLAGVAGPGGISEADFAALEIGAAGVAVGVVIDLIDPMAVPPNIPVGDNQQVLSLSFTCVSGGCPDAPGEELVTPISFCDGDVGDPPKENLIVKGGMSIGVNEGLALVPGAITWKRECIPSREVCNGKDDDCDGLIDEDGVCDTFDFEVIDPETGEPICIDVPVNDDPGTGEGVLYMNSPDIIDPDDDLLDSVQGFSLALALPCGKVVALEEFDTAGTILDAPPLGVGAEFIGIHADNDAVGGNEGCSLVIGVLLDAVPPFDGQVIPGLPFPQALGTLSFEAGPDAVCGEILTITAQDGAKGRGDVPVRNVVSINNYAYCATVRPITICMIGEERFYRGDCNFSLRGDCYDPVEIADASAVISFLFQTSIFKFEPPCPDACDANDDGRIDLADAIGILYYLFVPGSPFPPAPGPGLDGGPPGIDETPDPLDCPAGTSCDIP